MLFSPLTLLPIFLECYDLRLYPLSNWKLRPQRICFAWLPLPSCQRHPFLFSPFPTSLFPFDPSSLSITEYSVRAWIRLLQINCFSFERWNFSGRAPNDCLSAFHVLFVLCALLFWAAIDHPYQLKWNSFFLCTLSLFFFRLAEPFALPPPWQICSRNPRHWPKVEMFWVFSCIFFLTPLKAIVLVFLQLALQIPFSRFRPAKNSPSVRAGSTLSVLLPALAISKGATVSFSPTALRASPCALFFFFFGFLGVIISHSSLL